MQIHPSEKPPRPRQSGSEPKAVRVVEKAIEAIPDKGRNRPTYEAAQKLGSRTNVIDPETYRNLEDRIRSRGGANNAEALARGLVDGKKNASGRSGGPRPKSEAKPAKPSPKTEAGRRDARRAIDESVPIEGTLGERYLTEVRKVIVPDGARCRFHPALPEFTKAGGTRPTPPAVIFPFVNAATGAEIDAIGAVYLSADGTKAVEIGRKGKLSRGERTGTGSSIILGDLDESDTVLLGEGPETVLSGVTATGLPGLAVFGVGYASADLPDHVQRVVVLADHRAATTVDKQIASLQKRYPSKEFIVIRTPDPCHDDFNDLLIAEDADAVRRVIDAAIVKAETEPNSGAAGASVDWPETNLRTGQPLPRSQANIVAYLEHERIELRHNVFARIREFRTHTSDWRPLTDDNLLRWWAAADALGLRPNRNYFIDIVLALAGKCEHHPVLDYLARLTWDGVPRVARWLATYCGARDDAYTQAVGRNWLAAAVRRVKRPGSKFDSMLVLEGPQDLGKSRALRTLAGDDWFTDNLRIGAEPKVVIEQTAGKWLIEFAELAGLGKRAAADVKAFLSRQSDESRLSYGRLTEQRPRAFVCAATVNPEAAGTYLLDATGNRRFWPVTVSRCDVDALARDRDQLWAEAVEIEATGEDLYLSGDTAERARTEQAQRLVEDPWLDAIERFLAGRRDFVPTAALWKALDLDASRQDPKVSSRLSTVMAALGFQKTQRRAGGVSMRGFATADGSSGIDGVTSARTCPN